MNKQRSLEVVVGAFMANAVAKTISGGYKSLRVLGAEERRIAEAHLALFTAAKYVLHTGLTLIGVPPLERM